MWQLRKPRIHRNKVQVVLVYCKVIHVPTVNPNTDIFPSEAWILYFGKIIYFFWIPKSTFTFFSRWQLKANFMPIFFEDCRQVLCIVFLLRSTFISDMNNFFLSRRQFFIKGPTKYFVQDKP